MFVGERAPDFVATDHAGRMRSLNSMLADGPIVLFFYPLASSPICTAEACRFQDLGPEFAALGAQRIGVSTDTVTRQSRFATQRAFNYPLLCDTRSLVTARFGVRRRVFGSLGQWLLRRRESGGGRHTQPGWFTRLLLSAKRTTFVIDTDRTILKVITSELQANVHADLALHYLRERPPTPTNPPRIPEQRPASERTRISLGALRRGTA